MYCNSMLHRDSKCCFSVPVTHLVTKHNISLLGFIAPAVLGRASACSCNCDVEDIATNPVSK